MSILDFNVGEMFSRSMQEINQQWASDMDRFHAESIERMKSMDENMRAFREKLSAQNAEYNALMKSMETNQPTENEFPVNNTALDNPEYNNFFHVENTSPGVRNLHPTLSAPRMTYSDIYNKMQEVERQTGMPNPLSAPIETTRSIDTAKADSKEYTSFAELMNKRAVDAARSTYETNYNIEKIHYQSAEKAYAKAIEKIADPKNSDLTFWTKSADRARKDMAFYLKAIDKSEKTMAQWDK